MSEDRSDQGAGGGISATALVVRGGNREVEVGVDLVCLHPDGQYKYEVRAVGKVVIPAGDPIPVFVPNGRPQSIIVANHVPLVPPGFQLKAHTVCRDPEGRVKWEADTEPFAVHAGVPCPPELAVCNSEVYATPRPLREGETLGH